MDFALSTQGQGSTAHITFANFQPNASAATGGTAFFEAEYELHEMAANGIGYVCGSTVTSVNGFSLSAAFAPRFASGGTIRLTGADGVGALNRRDKFRIEYDDTGSGTTAQFRLYHRAGPTGTLNLVGSWTGSIPQAQTLVNCFGRSTTNYNAITIYNASCGSTGSASNYAADWTSATATGSGTTWQDTLAANPLTIVGATGAANSWWISYGGSLNIGTGIGSTSGDGFDLSRVALLTSGRQFTTGDSYDLSRLATAFAARNYTTGDGFDRDTAAALTAARNLTSGDGFDLARLSASFSARNLTTGDGFGYGQAQFGTTLIIGTGIGATLGDGFDRSSAAAALPAQSIPTYGIPVTYASATVRASINAATIADDSSLARAAIGAADLHLGVFLEPTVNSMFSLNSGSFVLSYASAYSRSFAREGRELVPIEYRRTTIALKQKSFEAANPWTNRQFTTSGSINTQIQ